MGYPPRNGGSMFNLFLDHLQTLRSTLELSGLMGESWVFIYQTGAISVMGSWPPQRKSRLHLFTLSPSHTECHPKQDWLTMTSSMKMPNSSFLTWLLQVFDCVQVDISYYNRSSCFDCKYGIKILVNLAPCISPLDYRIQSKYFSTSKPYLIQKHSDNKDTCIWY